MTEFEKKSHVIQFLHELFRGNYILEDFEDVSVLTVKRPFAQDPSGGLHIQFSVSGHYLGKNTKAIEWINPVLDEQKEGAS